eukprot:UN08160
MGALEVFHFFDIRYALQCFDISSRGKLRSKKQFLRLLRRFETIFTLFETVFTQNPPFTKVKENRRQNDRILKKSEKSIFHQCYLTV